MLTHYKPVCLSLMSLDMPLWSVIETAAAIYQKDQERFHLVFTEPLVLDFHEPMLKEGTPSFQTPRLLWLEISPYRVMMTMQGNGNLSYRHFWEQGVYGLSRYWLHDDTLKTRNQLRLRNFTRSLTLTQKPLPSHLRVDYELWADKLQLGHYVLNLEIQS